MNTCNYWWITLTMDLEKMPVASGSLISICSFTLQFQELKNIESNRLTSENLLFCKTIRSSCKTISFSKFKMYQKVVTEIFGWYFFLFKMALLPILLNFSRIFYFSIVFTGSPLKITWNMHFVNKDLQCAVFEDIN